jgi:hypothetical protein
MILNTQNLPGYLLARGLVSYDSIVDGALLVTDASHRNRAFRVLRADQPGYFVKQIREWDPVSIAGWAQEDACYRRFASCSFLPRRHASDAESRILVLELATPSETLGEHHRRLASAPVDVGQKQGAALSALHRATQGAQEPVKIPWILSVQETDPALFDSLSSANARLLETVQGYPEYCRLLSALRDEWQPSCLIHGDVKWDNFLIRDSESANPNILLVDWELAAFGDPCWDAGSVFQSYLNFWIYSMPLHETTQADLLVSRAQWPIERLQPAIGGFWESYASGMQWDSETARPMLLRSVRCGAARMVQTAYEMLHHRQEMPPVGAAMLQTSFNILSRPATAVKELLGLNL